MPRRPDIPCAGTCGKLIWRGRGGLPPGQATCRDCRRSVAMTPSQSANHLGDQSWLCCVCGATFTAERARSTCSRACYLVRMAQVSAIGRAVRHERHGPPKCRRVCEVCQSQYRASYPDQRTCGRRCGAVINVRERRPRAKRPVEPAKIRQCVECGGEIKESRARLCSDECRRLRKLEHDRRYSAAYRPAATSRPCLGCGQEVAGYKRKKCANCIAATRKNRKRSERRRRRLLRVARKALHPRRDRPSRQVHLRDLPQAGRDDQVRSSPEGADY